METMVKRELALRARRGLEVLIASGLVALLAAACSSSSGPGENSCQGVVIDCMATTLPCTQGGSIGDGMGHSLKTFCPPTDPGPGKIYVTASGETLSLVGFPFPIAPPPDDTYMVDGWNFQLKAYITVFTAVTLWTDPDLSPSDELLHGPQVDQLNGPFVVDLHKGTSAGPIIEGQGGTGEEATPIGVLGKDVALDPGTVYAFGFSTVAAPANYDAYNVNLDATEAPYYAYMQENGYSVLYVGTATWAGNQPWPYTGDGSQPSPSPAGSLEPNGAYCTATNVTPAYDFEEPPFPTTMQFWLGFSTPTNYVNCQNGSEFQGQLGIGGEDHPRGIQPSATQSEPAQITIHMDHPFWESFAENSPLHFDPIAAQFVGKSQVTCDPTLPGGGPTCLHTEDLKTLGGGPTNPPLDFTAFADGNVSSAFPYGHPLPFRDCVGSLYTPLGEGQLHYDPLTVPVCIGNDARAAVGECLGSYYDFIRYSQSTQGHLNSQGFCFIDRQYPAPGASPSGQ